MYWQTYTLPSYGETAMQVGQLFWVFWRGMRRISMREALCGGFDRVCLPTTAPAQHLIACVAAACMLGTEVVKKNLLFADLKDQESATRSTAAPGRCSAPC